MIMGKSMVVLLTFGLVATAAYANGKDLKDADLKGLLESGKTFRLGGKSMGYTGTLTVSSDGSAIGSAETNDGTKISISGKWHIKKNRFCRTWEKLDGGKEVCERWHLVAPGQVEVYKGWELIGLNSW